MADYQNLISSTWMLKHNDITYRIIPGINRNLPENIISKNLKSLSDVTDKDVQNQKEELTKNVTLEYEKKRNDIILDDTLLENQRNLCLSVLKINFENKIKEIKGESNEEI